MVKKLIGYFFSDANYKKQTVWFKKCLYLLILIKCTYWLYYFNLLFGPNSIVYPALEPTNTYRDLAFFLHYHPADILSFLFIAGLILLCLIQLLTNKFYFFVDFIIWFFVLNLQNKIYPSLTSGNYLLNQFLFFNCLLTSYFSANQNWKHELKILMHNLGTVAIIIQICLLYFLSGYAKITNPDWYGGSAVSMVANIHRYSLFHTIGVLQTKNTVNAGLTYLVTFYQLCFPILIWIKKTKKIFLLIGLLMHLYIGLVMGLPEFAAIMILSYIYFWPINKPVS